MEEAIRVARRHAVKVALNPAPLQALPDELLREVDVLIPNQSELHLLSGEGDIEASIYSLQQRGVQNLIITLGNQGCLVVQGSERYPIPAHRLNLWIQPQPGMPLWERLLSPGQKGNPCWRLPGGAMPPVPWQLLARVHSLPYHLARKFYPCSSSGDEL